MEDKTAEKKIYSSGYAGTIPGVHKEINEDFVIFFEKEPEGTVGASNLYVLTDGVTGTFHPEITARFAGKKILYEYFKSADFIDANKLALAMRNANNEIYAYAELKQEKMATVALATAITDGNAVIGTIGDSRVYVVRNDKVYQITEDQNILEEKVRKGELTKEEAFETETHKPVIRALGSEKDIVVDIYDGIEVKPGDVLLMCSDGLTAYIGKDEILEAVQADTPKEIVRNLLAYAANQNSPADASAIAIKIYDENTIQTVVRQPGTLPVDTDLNKETKELDLMMKSKPRHQPEKTEKKGTKKTSAYIISALLICLVIGGIFWFFSDSEGRPSLFGPRMTATATVDPVQATLAIIHQTQQAEAIARLLRHRPLR
ncbi:MAG TPA: protein phosphatase 2C domain-containing protein [Flexilinea sp.]|nr:protein phosphatase 2C domain-containing protein [Flexilinea sp.]